jgi:hypothetical protein
MFFPKVTRYLHKKHASMSYRIPPPCVIFSAMIALALLPSVLAAATEIHTQGSHHGFAVEVGTYRFHAADTNSVTISTAGPDGKVIADGVAFVKVMPGAGNRLTTASGQEPFLPLLLVESGDAPWSAHVVPRSGPQRDGQPTMALRWQVDQQPGPDSPDLLLGWQDVQAVRFWLYVDAPRGEACNVLLTGQRGYFMTSVPLDFSGWRQMTIPIQQFRMVRKGALDEMRRLSFRMQGYGQSPLDEDTIWWIDQIEVQPKPGAKLRMTTSLESNRKAWQELADAGNPFFTLLTRRFDTELAPFQPPETVPNAWQFRTIAERLVPVAYAAAEGEPPLAGREDLVNHAVETVDWLLDQCSPEGWWWRRGPVTGDPNVNRFTLGPLLDAVRFLRKLPAGQAAWPRWRETLDRAIELQRRAYRGQEDWDWGGRPAGQYANQDLYYALIMALSAELFERPDDRRLAEDMMQQVAANLLPDGGIRYIGLTNESPVYHALNLVLIGRYLTLTGDETARQLLRGTANYWPLVLTAEGQPESWSDVWWKQTWGYVRPEALVVSAGGTGDPRHQWLLWRVLERTAPADGNWFALCCAPYWTGTDLGEPMPDRFLVPDGNMRGLRGRQGSWYFGVGQGRGLRNTFVGGLITHPSTARPLQAAFRGAQIDVLPQEIPWRGYGQWLSELDDTAGLALRPGVRAAIGVRYTLQPGRISGWPPPETPASPWQVTQIWRADGSGHVGVVVLEATADAPGATVAGRIALGPQMPELVEPDRWQSGPIGVRRYHGFGTARTGPTPHYNTRPENAWHGVIFEQTLDGGARRGDRFVYAVWVGPHDAAVPRRGCEKIGTGTFATSDFPGFSLFPLGASPIFSQPQSVELLPDDMGWIAVSAEGRQEAVVFNATEDPRTITLPWSEKSPQAWTGSNGASLTIAHENGHCRITLAPGQCAIVE